MIIKRITFVCTGNTCRSPMAEIVLKNKLKLAGIKGVHVFSAGTTAIDGEKMSKNSAQALKKLGYKPYGFKSKKLTASMLLKSDLTVCMTASHKIGISNFPGVYCASQITGQTDIIDPYGGDLSVYLNTLYQIEDLCNRIIAVILQNKESK